MKETRGPRGPYKTKWSGIDEKEFRKILRKERPDGKEYTILEYNGWGKTVRFRHKCGFEAQGNTRRLLKIHVCHCVSGKRVKSHTEQTVTAGLKKAGYTDWKVYKFKDHKKVQFEHSCGHKEWATANSFINRPHGQRKVCLKCEGKFGNRLTDEEVLKLCKERGFKLLKRKQQKNFENRTLLTVECKKCKTVRDIGLQDIRKRKYPCLNCLPSVELRVLGKQFFEPKEVRFGGKVFNVQGAEDLAIEYLVKSKGVSPGNILTTRDNHNKVPKIRYKFNGKMRTYYPDLYIPELDLVVEAKCSATLGAYKSKGNKALFGGKICNVFYKNAAKARATKCAGHNFLLLAFDRKYYTSSVTRVRLPKGWEEMTWSKVIKSVDKVDFVTSLV
jgi:hypothetical protein